MHPIAKLVRVEEPVRHAECERLSAHDEHAALLPKPLPHQVDHLHLASVAVENDQLADPRAPNGAA